MNERFYDLSFNKIAGGTVRLTQTDCGEDSIIDAHPEQLKFIVRCLCGMDSATAAKIEDLERRISVLADKLVRLIDDKWFRGEIVEHCSDGIEMLAKLDGIVDLAVEFDGGRLMPPGTQTETATTKTEPQPTGNPSVTQPVSAKTQQQLDLVPPSTH